MKRYITGACIEYSSRKKKERKQDKTKLLSDIEKIKLQLSTCNDSLQDEALLLQLDEFKEKLDKIYNFETKGLIMRSRVRWLEEGEKSSKYLCNLEKRSWQRKTINRLKNDDNELFFDSPSVLKNIQDFYTKLYSLPDDLQNTLDENNVNEALFDNITIPKLSDDNKTFLETPLSKHELLEVVISMKMNKTTGYDGIPIELYVVFWPDICDLLLNSFKFSLQQGMMSSSQRNGVISLIPKKDKDPLLIRNYRPITLLTTDYKMLAKCLANRLKRCMQDLIHSDQSGFMKGRNIGPNIRLILDIIEYTDFNNIPGSIILIDIEKAFDSVSHNFLFQTLKQFNFGSNFIDSIRTLYSARQSYVMNNGFF